MPAEEPIRWLATCEEEGSVVFRIGRAADALVAEWTGVARLVASRDGRCSDLTFEESVAPLLREKIARGTAMLLLRQLRGELGFHGSAVSLDGRGVVFLGRSGEGKSTATYALCTHFGATMLADDAVAIAQPAIRGVTVLPSEGSHWLDGGDGKRPCPAERLAPSPVPLYAFVQLAFSDGPARLESVTPLDAMAALVAGCARFVIDEDETMRNEVHRLSALAQGVPFIRLCRPRDLGQLDASHRPLALWLASLPLME